MGRDKAYQKAEKKIEEARRSGARELDLNGRRSEESQKLIVVPESLGQLTRLQTLVLSYNQLTALPESLSQLTQLEGLYVYVNRWDWKARRTGAH
jgi:Leucine-rich repeat (LRR) protein